MSKSVIISSTSVAIPLRVALESYLNWCASGAGHTARAKRSDLGLLIKFVGEGAFLYDLTRQVIEDFRDACLDKGEAPATVARRLATIKHFCGKCAVMFRDFINPSTEVRGPYKQVRRPSCLTDAELAALRRAAGQIGNNEFFRSRNHAVMETALCMGLRRFELCLLTEGQLDPQVSELRDIRGKGGTFVTLPISERLRPILTAWLRERHEALTAYDRRYPLLTPKQRDRYPLFLTFSMARQGDADSYALEGKTVWRIFKLAGELAGIDGMRPHRARHTFVDQVYSRTGDIRMASRAARHANIETTMKYLEPDEEKFRASFEG